MSMESHTVTYLCCPGEALSDTKPGLLRGSQPAKKHRYNELNIVLLES